MIFGCYAVILDTELYLQSSKEKTGQGKTRVRMMNILICGDRSLRPRGLKNSLRVSEDNTAQLAKNQHKPRSNDKCDMM